ncbi:uncharacterized protein TEOVI_000201800 [Trypanosoma equiperdum]|uniref:Glycogenin glucosyltransferase n=2 Tax=Trypanozoon TaxID=39700 RepID=Q383H3_TRYB2|nr:hypothetical protein, conserved [Trypanosoma brucei brucei TREU927]EAN80058.1 hypothetical protein, conserved [Trypanosoma brucei brucei TREU927]SCU70445.1 hypothetical protein, conserved [Trypanosoma equiperdum]
MTIVADCGNSQAVTSVCTMGTPECDEELRLFLRCLRALHPHVQVVVGCTSGMISPGRSASSAFADFGMDEKIEWVPCLDPYLPINRGTMEQQHGVWYPSRHADFMMEKANLMERAMMLHSPQKPCGGGPECVVAFLDCDVVLLGELPCIPFGTQVALSPHQLRTRDEALFGKYNGGYVVATTPSVIYEWRRATQYSRYFDQASLECVANSFSSTLYELPPQHNYGYWRLFQTYRVDPLAEAKQFSIKPMGSPRQWTLCYEGAPLRSIHTHLLTSTCRQGRDVQAFNTLIRRWIQRCVQPPHRVTTAAVAANRLYEVCLGPYLKVAGQKLSKAPP